MVPLLASRRSPRASPRHSGGHNLADYLLPPRRHVLHRRSTACLANVPRVDSVVNSSVVYPVVPEFLTRFANHDCWTVPPPATDSTRRSTLCVATELDNIANFEHVLNRRRCCALSENSTQLPVPHNTNKRLLRPPLDIQQGTRRNFGA